jgi:hypothetical protein
MKRNGPFWHNLKPYAARAHVNRRVSRHEIPRLERQRKDIPVAQK